MTIDERLERLTERHEALTQTVELMAAENRDRDAKWAKQMGEIMEGIARLRALTSSNLAEQPRANY